MTTTNHGRLLSMLEKLFPNGEPSSLKELRSECSHAERAYGEMLTQVPTEIHQALTALRDLQSAEMRLLLAALEAKLT